MKKIIMMGSFFLTASLFAATSTPPAAPKTAAKAPIITEATKDRFTTTEDHKLGSQIRIVIAEIIGAPKGNGVILVVDEGDVKLIGKVPSQDVKTKIGQSVQQIKGVKSVHNKLEITK